MYFWFHSLPLKSDGESGQRGKMCQLCCPLNVANCIILAYHLIFRKGPLYAAACDWEIHMSEKHLYENVHFYEHFYLVIL